MSALIGNDGSVLDVALHHDVSTRPVINTGVICWVDLHTPGGAHSMGISKVRAGCPAELSSCSSVRPADLAAADAAGARAPADDEAAPADPLRVRGVLGRGADVEILTNLCSVPRLDEEASLDDPSSVGAQPAPRARPGVGPRRGTGPFGVGVLAPVDAAAAAATAGPLDRRRRAGCPASRCCYLQDWGHPGFSCSSV
eukprot:4210815-Pyramimonas_sp.AAC.1